MLFAYADETTVDAGSTAVLHVSTGAPPFTVEFFRQGARLERTDLHFGPFNAALQNDGAPDRPWDWPRYGLHIPSSARSGAYLAVCRDSAGEHTSTLFIIRNRRPEARLLYVLPTLTYHAYNIATTDGRTGGDEGASLYSGFKRITMHRPGGGAGGHTWDEVNADAYDRASPRQTFAHWDAKAIAWMEASGFLLEFSTDLGLHRQCEPAGRFRGLVAFGHFEYWTSAIRDAVTQFLDDGGNVALFSGNTCCFELAYDETARAIQRVGHWDDEPEARLTGVSYADGGGKWRGERPPSGYTVWDREHWVFEGTGLQRGHAFGSEERLLGYECDGSGSATPADFHPLADASISHWPVQDGSGELNGAAHATLGIRETAGGFLFTASTTDWARVLAERHPAVERITRNVLERASRP
jgi:hypothetical protein